MQEVCMPSFIIIGLIVWQFTRHMQANGLFRDDQLRNKRANRKRCRLKKNNLPNAPVTFKRISQRLSTYGTFHTLIYVGFYVRITSMFSRSVTYKRTAQRKRQRNRHFCGNFNFFALFFLFNVIFNVDQRKWLFSEKKRCT